MPTGAKLISYLRIKNLKNPTLFLGTYLYMTQILKYPSPLLTPNSQALTNVTDSQLKSTTLETLCVGVFLNICLLVFVRALFWDGYLLENAIPYHTHTAYFNANKE